MNLYIEEKNGVAVIHIYGTLMFGTVDEAEVKWKEVLKTKPDILALDMREVTQVDSTGISRLIKLSNESKISDVELILYGMNDIVMDLFKIACFDRLFKIMTEEQFSSHGKIEDA